MAWWELVGMLGAGESGEGQYEIQQLNLQELLSSVLPSAAPNAEATYPDTISEPDLPAGTEISYGFEMGLPGYWVDPDDADDMAGVQVASRSAESVVPVTVAELVNTTVEEDTLTGVTPLTPIVGIWEDPDNPTVVGPRVGGVYHAQIGLIPRAKDFAALVGAREVRIERYMGHKENVYLVRDWTELSRTKNGVIWDFYLRPADVEVGYRVKYRGAGKTEWSEWHVVPKPTISKQQIQKPGSSYGSTISGVPVVPGPSEPVPPSGPVDAEINLETASSSLTRIVEIGNLQADMTFDSTGMLWNGASTSGTAGIREDRAYDIDNMIEAEFKINPQGDYGNHYTLALIVNWHPSNEQTNNALFRSDAALGSAYYLDGGSVGISLSDGVGLDINIWGYAGGLVPPVDLTSGFANALDAWNDLKARGGLWLKISWDKDLEEWTFSYRFDDESTYTVIATRGTGIAVSSVMPCFGMYGNPSRNTKISNLNVRYTIPESKTITSPDPTDMGMDCLFDMYLGSVVSLDATEMTNLGNLGVNFNRGTTATFPEIADYLIVNWGERHAYYDNRGAAASQNQEQDSAFNNDIKTATTHIAWFAVFAVDQNFSLSSTWETVYFGNSFANAVLFAVGMYNHPIITGGIDKIFVRFLNSVSDSVVHYVGPASGFVRGKTYLVIGTYDIGTTDSKIWIHEDGIEDVDSYDDTGILRTTGFSGTGLIRWGRGASNSPGKHYAWGYRRDTPWTRDERQQLLDHYESRGVITV